MTAGKLQVWAEGYWKVHRVNKEANQKALLDCQIITNFLFFFLVLFSSFFFQYLPRLIPFASYGKLGCSLPSLFALLRDEEVTVYFSFSINFGGLVTTDPEALFWHSPGTCLPYLRGTEY